MPVVRPVRDEEVAATSELVGRVFADDAMVTWTVPQGVEPGWASEAFFAAFHRACFAEGWMWVAGSEAVDGMAMWVPPDPDDRYGGVLHEIDPEVAEIMGERKARYDAFWAWIDEHRPAEPHWYLEHIAVAPERRGAGLGRALIDLGLKRVDAGGAAAWLVTSKPGNVALYERFGFGVRSEENAPGGGPHLFFMERNPA